jgi:glycosyltransferase A (GT-A) superfamily protein (DUF2064 family)
MSVVDAEERFPILVQLTPRPGLLQVSLAPRLSPEELAELSDRAIDSAMRTVQRMSERVSDMIDDLAGDPDEVKVQFGLALNVEGQALVAKGGAEAAVNVTLIWKRQEAIGE